MSLRRGSVKKEGQQEPREGTEAAQHKGKLETVTSYFHNNERDDKKNRKYLSLIDKINKTAITGKNVRELLLLSSRGRCARASGRFIL